MADFKVAYDKLSIYEGGYCNNLRDSGGETYRGIARNFNKAWAGWPFIDSMRKRADFPECIETDEELKRMVSYFYKSNYWDVLKGDYINDQSIAEELFEQAVNCGISTAVKFIQLSINILKKSGIDLVVDGVFGQITLLRVNDFCLYDSSELLFKVLNIHQGSYYLELAQINDKYKSFIRGWLTRVRN